MAVAFGASRSSHSLVVIGWPVSGLLPKPHQYPSDLIASFGMEPSTTRTNGSSSPRSALCHHSMKVSAPCSGPHSKSISGQCTATLGSPGKAPSAISSMLGWVAAVSATESPSQPSPPFIQNVYDWLFRGMAHPDRGAEPWLPGRGNAASPPLTCWWGAVHDRSSHAHQAPARGDYAVTGSPSLDLPPRDHKTEQSLGGHNCLPFRLVYGALFHVPSLHTPVTAAAGRFRVIRDRRVAMDKPADVVS